MTEWWDRQRYLMRAIVALHPDTIVVFVDAFDVLFAGDLTEIVRKFRTLGAPLVLSGECNCFPFALYSNATCDRVAVADGPYRCALRSYGRQLPADLPTPPSPPARRTQRAAAGS